MVSCRVRWIAVACVLAACGAADGPLDVTLGGSRAATEAALRDRAYCRDSAQARAAVEVVYPRCARAGGEDGDSWVWARYEDDHAVALRRWERFGDPAAAEARWNDLAARRARSHPATDEARAAVRAAVPLLPAGTQRWLAFRIDARFAVGLYLLAPTPPERANLLEEVVVAPLADAAGR